MRMARALDLPVCWKSNRGIQDATCWQCASPRGLTESAAEVERKAREAVIANRAKPVPDLLVALPVVVFAATPRTWRRGGLSLLAVQVLHGDGRHDRRSLVATASGVRLLADEVMDGMRERTIWAFVVGLILSVVGAVGSVLAISRRSREPHQPEWGARDQPPRLGGAAARRRPRAPVRHRPAA